GAVAHEVSARLPASGSVRRVTTSAGRLRQQVVDGDGRGTVRAHADRADPAAGELLEAVHVATGVLRRLVDGAGPGEVLRPTGQGLVDRDGGRELRASHPHPPGSP